jgi:hypothetical protein
MAIPQQPEVQPVDAHELAAALAEMVRHEPSVLRMWVSSHRGVAHFWLLTPEIETKDELRLYGLSGKLFDRFPESDFHLHVVNPRDYEWFELDIVLPKGAEEIALRAA